MSHIVRLAPRPPRPKLESDIVEEIRIRLAKIPGVLLWRNNVGQMSKIDVHGKEWTVRYGLATGSADLIGSVTRFVYDGVTNNKIGHAGCRPLAIEVKRPNKRATEDQERWLALVKAHGWIAGICTSADEAEDLVCGF